MTAMFTFLQHWKITKEFDSCFCKSLFVLAYAVVGPEVSRFRQADVQVQVGLVHIEVFRRDQVLVL